MNISHNTDTVANSTRDALVVPSLPRKPAVHAYPHWFLRARNEFEGRLRSHIENFHTGPVATLLPSALYPGRRVRPTLYYALWERHTGSFPKGHDELPGIAVELFHAASIILDDIADREECRRDKVPFYRHHGAASAALMSHWLVGTACEILSLHPKAPALMRAWQENYLRAIEGEFCELVSSDPTNLTPTQRYLSTLQKTTAFFAFIGRCLHQLLPLPPPALQDALVKTGECFQIANDVYDLLLLRESGRHQAGHCYPLRPSFLVTRLLETGIIDGNELLKEASYGRLLELSARARAVIPDARSFLVHELDEQRRFVKGAGLPPGLRDLLLDFISHSTESSFWLHHHA